MTRYPCEHTVIIGAQDACCHLPKYNPHQMPRRRRGKGASEVCFSASPFPAYPLLYFTGFWLQQHNLKGGDFKAGIWHFTKKTAVIFPVKKQVTHTLTNAEASPFLP